MTVHLNEFVKELFGDGLPPSSNQRYFPSSKTIRNHIDSGKRKRRQLMVDQESLVCKLEEWKKVKPGANIFFRPIGGKGSYRRK